MKPTLVWVMLIGALLLCDTDFAAAWNRQLYNRYSRNLYRNADVLSPPTNEIDELTALFGGAAAGAAVMGGGPVGAGVLDNGPQQTEVYGIVEPLIEDLPCVDRPCQVNGDCCPSGVCMKQYAGEAKCMYMYGRKPDFCHRHSDCQPGLSCLKAAAGNMMCQPSPLLHLFGSAVNHEKSLERQFGDECYTTSDCNVAKGMCCQLQRSHHSVVPKRMCAYFRDPFMCIDIMPSAEEDGSHFLASFNQKRM